MIIPAAFLYLAGAAFLAGLLLTFAVRAVARRFGLAVQPRPDRWHTRPTALYGGVAIALAALTPLLLILPLRLDIPPSSPALAIVAASCMMFVLGVVDDAFGVGPVGKFIIQLTAATVLVAAGVIYTVSPWTPLNVIATLFWFVGVTNALNLLDNMDGIAGGVAAVAAIAFALLLAAVGDLTLAAIALSLAGAVTGFLVYNFKPASIFMGDGGSLFLGAYLAGLGAAYPTIAAGAVPLAAIIPALVLLVPIVDTTLVTVTRTLQDRRISVGGKDHTTHRLVAMGFSETQTALFLYGAAILTLLTAWIVAHADLVTGGILSVVLLIGSLLFAGYLGNLVGPDENRHENIGGRGALLRYVLLKRRALVLLLDVALFGLAYYLAFLIYYDGSIPAGAIVVANRTLAAVIIVKVLSFHYFRVYDTHWEKAGIADVNRVLKATLLGGLMVVAALFLLARGVGVPRFVILLDVLLTAVLALGARASFMSLDHFRRRLQPPTGLPALIYGTGRHSDLVWRTLESTPEFGLSTVAFVGADSDAAGRLLHGFPVLSTAEAEAWVKAGKIVEVVIPMQIEDTLPPKFVSRCTSAGARFRRLSFALGTLEFWTREDLDAAKLIGA